MHLMHLYIRYSRAVAQLSLLGAWRRDARASSSRCARAAALLLSPLGEQHQTPHSLSPLSPLDVNGHHVILYRPTQTQPQPPVDDLLPAWPAALRTRAPARPRPAPGAGKTPRVTPRGRYGLLPERDVVRRVRDPAPPVVRPAAASPDEVGVRLQGGNGRRLRGSNWHLYGVKLFAVDSNLCTNHLF
jgi:hypothetical protein